MNARLGRFTSLSLVLAALLALLTSPARCQQPGGLGGQMTLNDSTVVDKITLEQMLSLMKSEGYAVTLTDKDDIVWKIDGLSVVIFVVNNTSISCLFGYNDITPTLEQINAWNRTKRFSTSYLNDRGHPFLELDLELDKGVTVGRIKDFLKTCRVSIAKWSAEIVK